MSRRLAFAAALAPPLLMPAIAHAARPAASDGLATHPLMLVLVMGALSLVPFALLMTTCFVKVSVVLSILRSAIGAPQVPPTQVITGLALILTVYVMAPTGERMYDAVKPVMAMGAGAELVSGQTVEALQAASARAKEPLREFLLKQADPRDRATFYTLALRMRTATERASITDRDLLVVVPAFVTSELKRAFEIGFLLFIPFLVLDLVISNLLLALGMHMLSPTTVSLPFKLLLFVLADGWHLVVRGLVESYL
ncbi:MAG TPA: type III secretion system export apparatus subunit SctR [Polyangia bacterium]|jgi:type III secretion protein R